MSKILYIDMDGVIADFEAGMAKIAPHIELGEHHTIPYEERSKQVDDAVLNNPGFFESLPLIDGAFDAVEQLSTCGLYEVFFLSTPMCNVTHSYGGKRQWLQDNFGSWTEKRLILTHRKDLAIGDILIDDRTRNGAQEFKGELLLFGGAKFPNGESILKYLL